MNKKTIKLSTHLNQQEIKTCFEKSIKDKFTSFDFLFRNEYQGKIDDTNFKFITKDAPPMEITGTFVDKQVEFTITWDSLKNSLKGYIYAFGYTIIAAIFLFIVTKYPNSFWVYFLGFISLIIPYLIYKYFLLFHYSEPKPKLVINHIKKIVKGSSFED
ncbi:hypothetical protein [Seonamhaeicola maritimus]|uniref:Uncharacterized protein n=1 Tax=Seonamhaeicola maritimus TaxID=2591822 RepID=A0A5C7GGA7_9FLAO|nr:hypothetical protein [Seonamhaeicola maritimus]TXG36780.1 hypothetical protein FUA22_09385 [Seonamhaeicola maritimus]